MAFSAAVAKAVRVELLRLDLVDDLGDEIVAQSTVAIGIWNFSDVTVEHDSVLVVNSNGLFCDHLYAHATGKIIVSHGGPCLIEMNTYVPIHDVSGGGGEWWPAPGGVGHPPSAARRVT